MIISILQIVIFVLIKFGILPSISDSWYELTAIGGVWYSLFTWFCFGLGILMFFQTNGSTVLFFISGAGLSFVGAATMFKSSDYWTPKIHFGGAITGIFGALIGIGIERNLWIPAAVWAVGTILIEIFKIRNSTWWVEVLAFSCIGLGLLLSS